MHYITLHMGMHDYMSRIGIWSIIIVLFSIQIQMNSFILYANAITQSPHLLNNVLHDMCNGTIHEYMLLIQCICYLIIHVTTVKEFNTLTVH